VAFDKNPIREKKLLGFGRGGNCGIGAQIQATIPLDWTRG
jgi:hypothetical protein